MIEQIMLATGIIWVLGVSVALVAIGLNIWGPQPEPDPVLEELIANAKVLKAVKTEGKVSGEAVAAMRKKLGYFNG